MADGGLALFPTGLGGVEAGGEPSFHALRIGHLAVAPGREVVFLPFRRIEGEEIPGGILQVRLGGVPVVVVDAHLAIEAGQRVEAGGDGAALAGGLGLGEQVLAVLAEVFVHELVADDRADRLLQLGAEAGRIGVEENRRVRQQLLRVTFLAEGVEQVVAAGRAGQGAGEKFHLRVKRGGDILAAGCGFYPGEAREGSLQRGGGELLDLGGGRAKLG